MNNRLSVYLEQEILSAGRLRIVHLLYQAAITEIRDARRNMAARRIREKCLNLTRACAIVAELCGSLNHEQGGEIAIRLEALYNYILSRLLDANLRNADAPLGEVLALLATLDEAWTELANKELTNTGFANSDNTPGDAHLADSSLPARMVSGAFAAPEMAATAAHSWSL